VTSVTPLEREVDTFSSVLGLGKLAVIYNFIVSAKVRKSTDFSL
jgi:hypothetical protein